jgi:hypothetical protein
MSNFIFAVSVKTFDWGRQFITKRRQATLHVKAAERVSVFDTPRTIAIPVYGSYQDKFGRVEVFAPPAIFMSGPPVTIYRQ